MKSLGLTEFLEIYRQGALVFDTRSLAQFQHDALTGVRHLPLEAVQAGELPDAEKDTPIYLICERGVISELVGHYLEAAGFTTIYNVAGGMIAYRAGQRR
jgi:rhodanese-related sulfurtransferase